MTSFDLRELAAEAKRLGYKARVPRRAQYVRILEGLGLVTDFSSRAEFARWHNDRVQRHREAIQRFIEEHQHLLPARRKRTPIEAAIDKACGIE